MSRRRARIALAFALVGAVAVAPPARAANKKACIAAFEETQRLRAQDKLLAAREQLLICNDAGCPALVRKNCAEWLDELAPLMPSLVFRARSLEGAPVLASVTFDGAPVALEEAVACDPGEHRVRAELPDHVAIEERLVVRAGEQRRVVELVLREIEKTPPPPVVLQPVFPPPRRAERGWLAPVLGASGVAFVALGAVGVVTTTSTLDDLRSTCAPACDPADVRTLDLRYGLSAASFALGAVAIGAAAWFFFHPRRDGHGREAKDLVLRF